MENKAILEQGYKVSFDSAREYIKQNNLTEAKAMFQKALNYAIKLTEQSIGTERAGYLTKAKSIAQYLEQINAKLQTANNTPTTPGKPDARKDDKGSAADEAPRPKPSVEEALDKLNSLVGLDEVKREVNTLVAELKVQMLRQKRGMAESNTSHHLVFKGNPGTGKTTVARIMSDIYYSLGVLEKGQLVEVQRNDLVAGYVGQTAIKTQEVIEKAIGGVLFIDEAYTLAKGGNDFGQEAIDTLLKAIEDRRSEFIVIIAGYDEPIQTFIDSNAGLQSRFPTCIQFTDYNGEQMFKIFEGMCKKDQYTMDENVRSILKDKFNAMYANRGDNFGNARDVRNFFEKVKKKQNLRIANMGADISDDTIMALIPDDLVI